MDDADKQGELFKRQGRRRPPPEPNDETDEFEAEAPPQASPGQMTLDPTFDYHSDRTSGRARTRPALREIVFRLDAEQRMAAIAVIGIVVSFFMPWWQRPIDPKLTNSGISHVSFIELALMLVVASVLLLLYRRAEGREFHLPLADSTLAAIAGAWCAILIVVRLFNPPLIVSASDVEYDPHWGVFVAFGMAILLFVAGVRGRRRYHAGESEAVAADEDAIPTEPLRLRSR